MSIYSRVPSIPVFPAGDESSCLYRVDFSAYAEEIQHLSSVQPEHRVYEAEEDPVFRQQKQKNGNGLKNLVRLVGFHDELNELRMILSSSQNGNVWISGPRGSGKTSLVEVLLRLGAERRLTSQLLSKSVFFIDTSAFFRMPRDKWVDTLKIYIDHITKENGLVFIDHFDDFVCMAGSEAGRLVNTLITNLENSENTQAIIASENKHDEKISEVSTGIERRFQKIDLDGKKSDEEMIPILLAQFRMLERVHNVDFTEEAAEEIIRLLTRYPGRAFDGARPANAVTFADRVATHVKLNKYAEPPEVAELRERVGILTDRISVLYPLSEADKNLHDALEEQLGELKAKYEAADKEWRKKFAPIFEAQGVLCQLEERLRKQGQNTARSQLEEDDFSTLKECYRKQKSHISALERQLYPQPPRVTEQQIRHVFSQESKIPLSTLSDTHLKRLQELDLILDTQIFKQNDAKRALSNVYRNREIGVSDPSRPAGVLMFTGGTGLGKTELVKVLARFDGGEAAEPIIIRMSEFKGDTASKKLLGADPGYVGYEEGSPFLDPIDKNRRAIVLLDEADKAHPSVYNVIMQILEEGRICNSKGKLIDFKDTIIVIATNAVLIDDLTESERGDQNRIRERLLEARSLDNGEKLFTPEFLNRVDQICVFENLGAPEALKIFNKQLRKLGQDYAARGVSIEIDEATAQGIIDSHYEPSMNGRGPRKIIAKLIRPLLTEYLIDRMQARTEQEPLQDVVKIKLDGDTVSLERVKDKTLSRPSGGTVKMRPCGSEPT